MAQSASATWKNKYTNVGNFVEGMAWVDKDGKYGFVNPSLEVAVPIK